ncbi:outer membrane protein assembly factor BamB family protein [Halovenus salina]|uniref:outer membrane protein assembly factor BamB family protein n=1 Tax=Halovenus salina TaxID=1510225 RepID=UPI002260DF0C|nr:PQQ-binding-like beta-propeller repeat protein [Halovenus salina]
MSEVRNTVSLGDLSPNGSRQLGRRSAVCWADGTVVAGCDDGRLVAVDAETLAPRWQDDSLSGSVVSLSGTSADVLAGTRGPDGEVRCLDRETGAVRWRYQTADDIGTAQQDSRFFLPFVVDVLRADDRAYALARRYERGPDGERQFRSVVYCFESDGTRRWRHRTDASPISMDLLGDRLGVAFNRCPGDDGDGVRILDAEDGTVAGRWDPPGGGQRRCGDLSLLGDGFVAVSHADYRGYRIDGDRRWAVDLGGPVEQGGETVYSYPNHVHATDSGAFFLTGNTYPQEGRETDERHPNEHTAVGVGADGTVRWEAETGGFAHGIETAGDSVAVPVAQHFRERDPSVHGVYTFDVRDGPVASTATRGVATAVAVRDGGDAAVAIEEPVAYHDADSVRGRYCLRRVL